MSIVNMLAWWQWLVLAAVPLAIIALYFLKLKRQPLEVPSTYLWSRTIEDLHVNTIWQRLRQSLLLLLQLLLILLLVMSLLRPGWRGAQLTGDRFVFLIDTSASMQATDVKGSRLEEAKLRVRDLIDQMKTGDVAMIISVSNVARVEQPFTENRRLLRQKLNNIQPTNRRSNLEEALRYSAGLANPGRTSEDETDVQVAEALPATLYIVSDGKVDPVRDFSLGHLTPVYIPIGSENPHNVGIVAFTTDRNPEKPGQMQAFSRLENSGSSDATVSLSLYFNDRLIDATRVTLAAGGAQGVQFDLQNLEQGVLKLEIEERDDLSLDNVAHATINTSRRARVLLVTPVNDALKLACSTQGAQEIADISLGQPAILKTKAYQQQAQGGAFDVIIYDQCAPQDMPQANTLFIGRTPPLDQWKSGPRQGPPLVIDTDRVHPLMQFVELGNVKIAEGFPVTPPAGGATLVEADIGPLLAIAPREGFEDVVLSMEIVGSADGKVVANTDWPIRRSFPVFVMNVLKYLGGSRGALATRSVEPGEPMVLRASTPVSQILVESPGKEASQLLREGQNEFVYSNTRDLGIYQVFEGTSRQVAQRFAVNLFDSQESNLPPAESLEIAYEKVKGRASVEVLRRELWKWILLLGIIVLVFEWYVYNRRVYL